METGSDGDGQLLLEALGLRIGVRFVGAIDSEARSSLSRSWSRCQVESSGPTEHPDIEFDATIGTRAELPRGGVAAPDLPRLAHLLSPHVTVAAIDQLAGQIVMLHAAALCDRDGATAVFVGASGAGKTTVCRVLGRELGYVTDETVAIETDGSIRMYPKPLSVIEPGSTVKAQISPDDLGLASVDAAPRLTRIHLLERDDRHRGAPALEPTDKLDAIAALATQCSHLKLIPRPLHALADLIDSVGGATRARYADVAELLPMASELVAPR